MSRVEARKVAQAQAKEIRSGLAALHEPDSVIGGTKATHMGRPDVNSSIGGSWGRASNPNSRLSQLEQYAREMQANSFGGAKMDVRFGIETGAK